MRKGRNFLFMLPDDEGFPGPACDTETVVDTVAGYPHDPVSRTKDPDLFFIRQRYFLVDQEIADLLPHILSEWIKGIPGLPAPQGQWEDQLIEIKAGIFFTGRDVQVLINGNTSEAQNDRLNNPFCIFPYLIKVFIR